VVVDTGSTDRTPEIAQILGTRVFDLVRVDDFAAAATRRWREPLGDPLRGEGAPIGVPKCLSHGRGIYSESHKPSSRDGLTRIFDCVDSLKRFLRVVRS